jgi:DNA-binding MarR family transcriptional regulator
LSAHAAPPERDRAVAPIGEADWTHLAELRAGLRRYLAWAEERAREHDLTPAQVQLALAIRSHPEPCGPTLTELAATVLLRHPSAVGLVDRAERTGLVRRERDPDHHSRVHVRLTASGADRLETLSRLHLAWLSEHGPALARLWSAFEMDGPGLACP